MARKELLNLLMIDDNQIYAEALVDLLNNYYKEVNLGFLDNKEGFKKSLKKPWDILIFGKAYDMGFTDIVSILQDYKVDLPLICLVDNDKRIGRNKDGLPKIIDTYMIRSIPFSDKSQIVLAICVLHDSLLVRREMLAIKEILLESEQRANVLIKNSKSAVAYIDEGIHIFVNASYAELFGFHTPEDLIGLPIIDLVAPSTNIERFKQFLRRFDKGNRDQVEFKLAAKHKDGEIFESKLQLAAASFDGQLVTQVIIQPKIKSHVSKLAQKLAVAERRDSLTGLLNRLGFEEHFAQIYQSTKDNNECAALLFIRVDGIGKINSVSGIKGIDLTIKEVANTLKQSFSDSEVYRFSDNIFTVLMPRISSSEEVKQLAENARQKVAALFIEIDLRTITTTLSIGGVFIDSSASDLTKLMDRASKTLNQAFLESGNVGNVLKFYEPSLYAEDSDSVLAEYLQMSILQNKFKLCYQPIYDIETDSSSFHDVQVYLPLTNGNVMSPEKFYPVAVTHNLIEKIDRWVLINACKHLNKVRLTSPNAKIVVTLSSQTLVNSLLPRMVEQLVKAVGGNPEALTVQFCEVDLVSYMTVAKRQFSAIKETGSRVGIKEFGSTAKTIELADYLEPSFVKLAPNYVNDLKNADNMRIVKALVKKANDRSIPVIMPSIETAATMSAAWSVGARYLQGNYLQVASDNIIADETGRG